MRGRIEPSWRRRRAAAVAVFASSAAFLLLVPNKSAERALEGVGKSSRPYTRRATAASSSLQDVAGGESDAGENATAIRHGGPAFDGPFRQVYLCGMTPRAAAMLFPDYSGSYVSVMDSPSPVRPQPTEHDLLMAIHSLDLRRCVDGSMPGLNGEVLNFPGKMMFFNFEAADTHGGPRRVGDEGGPADGCVPGRGRGGAGRRIPGDDGCDDLTGTVASQVPALERTGGRFDYLPPSDRAYYFGPHRDSDRSIMLPFVSQLYLTRGFEVLGGTEWLSNPSEKPRNTGEHFAVFLASHCVPWRDEAAKRLAQLGEVHVGKLWRAQCEHTVPDPEEGPPPRLVLESNGSFRSNLWSNHDIMRRYKFALVMENTYREGYITEKIFHAFRSGAVPIWYGGKDVAMDIFNPEAFVFYDVEDPQPALDRIGFLRDHPEEYEKVMKSPILRDGERTVEKWFSLDDKVGDGKLKRRIQELIGVHKRSAQS